MDKIRYIKDSLIKNLTSSAGIYNKTITLHMLETSLPEYSFTDDGCGHFTVSIK